MKVLLNSRMILFISITRSVTPTERPNDLDL